MDVKYPYFLSGPNPKALRIYAEEGSLFLTAHLQTFLPAASVPALSQGCLALGERWFTWRVELSEILAVTLGSTVCSLAIGLLCLCNTICL